MNNPIKEPDMHSIIEELIATFHERPLPKLTAREAQLPALKGKIDVIIGMRRTGKTAFLHKQMQAYLDQGIPKERLLYINFDDERLLPFSTQNLQHIVETYYRLFPTHKHETCYFFFDEIQNIPEWEYFLRRLLDNENIQLCVTGSSAKLLSLEIATNLRGRSLTTEIFPFSFKELLAHEKIELPAIGHRPGAAKKSLLENRFFNYLQEGGFPETCLLDSHYRIPILQEYVDMVILRDIAERYKVSNILTLRHLVRHLLNSPACLLSINKFYNDLKTMGIPCSKNSLHEYLDYLSDSFLIYPISIHARSVRKQRINPKKIYLIDNGLIQAFSHTPHSNQGHLLENFVFMELRRRHLHIEYYQTEKGQEVDFITTNTRGETQLIQASLSLKDAATREREVSALLHAITECHLQKGYIISLIEEEIIQSGDVTIEVIPAWRWAIHYD